MLKRQHPAVGGRAAGLGHGRPQVGVPQQELSVVLRFGSGLVIGGHPLHGYLREALEDGFIAQQPGPPLLREHAEQGVPAVARIHENAQAGTGQGFSQEGNLSRGFGPGAAGHYIGEVAAQGLLIREHQVITDQHARTGHYLHGGGPGRGQQRPQHRGFREAHRMHLVRPYFGEGGRVAIEPAQAGQPAGGAARRGAAHESQAARPAASRRRREVAHRHFAPKRSSQAVQRGVAAHRVDQRPARPGPGAGGIGGQVQQQRRAHAQQARQTQGLSGLAPKALLQSIPRGFGIGKPLELRPTAGQLQP